MGRGKRAIEDHFTPDQEFVGELKRKNKAGLAEELKSFYGRVNDSTFVFINQPEPKGFGVYLEDLIDEELHLGDIFIK